MTSPSSNLIEKAEQLLLAVEKECNAVGLYINAKKTKYMTYNITEEVQMALGDGTPIGRATKKGHKTSCISAPG